MSILLWIIFGGLVGWVASIIIGGSNGIIMNVIIGVVGALLGGLIMVFFGKTGISGFNLYSFLVALLGAVVLIALARAIRRD